MMRLLNWVNWFGPRHLLPVFTLVLVLPALAWAGVSAHTNNEFSSTPVNLTQNVTPQVMITSSNDHQLFFKAYNDYSDLDGDGTPETTYSHEIDYYGYFDSSKCYDYDSGDQRFEPVATTADKYCTGANDAYWSGNFLNWAGMSRIDIIRKVLFGGHRRVDTAAETVLERAYLPHDAHSWAKYYDSSDLADLTPFTLANTGTSASARSVSNMTTSSTSLAIGNGNKVFTVADAGMINDGDFVFAHVATDSGKYMQGNATVVGNTVTINVTSSANKSDPGPHSNWKLLPQKEFFYSGGSWADDDWVRVERSSDPSIFMKGKIQESGGAIYLSVREASGITASTYNDWSIIHLQESGVTFCNTTDVNGGVYSQDVTEPPLIKVARGNYSLWAGNERWQCTWSSNDYNYDEHSASNANNIESSGIHSYGSSPAYTAGLGQKNYRARVLACDSTLLGDEKCKLYPGPDGVSGTADDNYKPIGLLQVYGDDDQMYFGMVAGTYDKHASGGSLIRNVGSMKDEINVDTDGTFKLVAVAAGGPKANNSAKGLINAWSLYRIVGYYHSNNDGGDNGTYNKSFPAGDDCKWGLSDLSVVTNSEKCNNWGNPFSEIFYQAINYFSGNGVIEDYKSESSRGIDGLPDPQTFSDSLNNNNYCARLSVVNFNSSIPSYDSDELDGSYGPDKIWDENDLPGDKTSTAMTDVVGAGEGLHDNKYFVGEVSGDTNGLCTEKTVTSLGDALGLCPELPRMRGSYRIAGLAHYAQTKDIRPGVIGDERYLQGSQTIDFYAVAMASAVPALEIPNPTDPDEIAVTILPACRNTELNPDGNCAIVDFKLVSQTVNNGNDVGTGKIYVNWEDSEQGGDYDQDMWGVLEYRLDAGAGTIEITTDVIAESTIYHMGFGYVISGTTQDGFHAHSGIESFDYNDPTGVTGCNNCQVGDAATTVSYTMGSSDASLLKDPLWYAAKWGNFSDSDGDGTPNLSSEWDRLNNETGADGADGIPDGYFFANNPAKLEEALNRVFLAILQRVSSGTAAAVVSNNVSGEGALYQAFYEPSRVDSSGNEANWIGTVQALWLDSFGYLREDADGDKVLDGYQTDQVVEFYFDEIENKTRARRLISIDDELFTPNHMVGTVTDYDDGSLSVTITVSDQGGGVGAGPFSPWTVYNLDRDKEGESPTSLTIADPEHPHPGNSVSFTLSSDDPAIAVGDKVMLAYTESESMELEDVSTLWNAREQLYFDLATDLALQRAYTVSAEGGRHIITWIDGDFDGVAAASEVVDFVATESEIIDHYELLDQASLAEAQDLVSYIRGKELAGYRSRTVDYDGSGNQVMRLGDIVNSTPVVVAAPQERFDLLTADTSYREFYKQYRQRRNVLYVGANDGMLHAFNAGFFVLSYSMTGTVAAYDSVTGLLTLDLTENSGFVGDGPFTSWVVRNNTNHHTGSSSDSLEITAVGGSIEFTVSPAGEWLSVGDVVEIEAEGDAPRFSAGGEKHDGSDAVEHPLGSELWAYVPMNLLPHLQWLKSPDYEHVYYMDAKPRIFDAKIFTKDDDHPGLAADTKGWGTVLVAPMRFGGGPMTVNVDGTNRDLSSALVIMDITNPEEPPRLLAEIPIPDGSFSTSSIEVMTFKDDPADDDDSDENKWYLLFGSGPLVDSHTTPNKRQDIYLAKRDSATSAKLYIMDMEQLINPGGSPADPFDVNCVVEAVGTAAAPIKLFACNTGVNDAFVGGIGAVDWDNPLNYKADTVYFGLVGDADADTGRMMRLALNETGDQTKWGAMHTLIDTTQPIISTPTPALDKLGNKWLYFGTGRLYVSDDHGSTTPQSLYGIKDDETGVALTKLDDLFDSSGIEVSTDESITRDGGADVLDASGAKIATFDDLEGMIDDGTYKGWYLDLPPIVGVAGTDPATRSLSEPVLLGGVSFYTVYQPSVDPCSGEGQSRLYGLYYKTGTGYVEPTVFGTAEELIGGEEKEISISYINLGRGYATTPALHSGAGLGGDKVEAFVQMSTGTVTQTEAGTLTGNIRSGRESWREQ